MQNKRLDGMKLLMAIVDALVGFVQRNPLLVLVILVLGLSAPALLKGIATVVLYVIVGLVALLVLVVVLFYLRIRSARRQMEEQFRQFGQQFGGNPGDPNNPFGAGGPFGAAGGGASRGGYGGRQQARGGAREGEVQIHQTADAPAKRVASDVGDYVDFEETKNE